MISREFISGEPLTMTGWKCACGIVNFPTDEKCKRCGTARPAPDPWAARPAPDPPQELHTISAILFCMTCRIYSQGQNEPVCPRCKGPWVLSQPVYPIAPPKWSVFNQVLTALLVYTVISVVVLWVLSFLARR